MLPRPAARSQRLPPVAADNNKYASSAKASLNQGTIMPDAVGRFRAFASSFFLPSLSPLQTRVCKSGNFPDTTRHIRRPRRPRPGCA